MHPEDVHGFTTITKVRRKAPAFRHGDIRRVAEGHSTLDEL